MPIRQRELARHKLEMGGVRDTVSGCRLWRGGTTGDGYGAVWIDGTSKVVHVVQWELTRGDVPPGRVVGHTCDRKLCFEVEHLEPITQKQNISDACLRGRMPGLTLDPDKVRAIRALKGKERASDVAVSFGVSTRMIYRVWKREAWGFVTDA